MNFAAAAVVAVVVFSIVLNTSCWFVDGAGHCCWLLCIHPFSAFPKELQVVQLSMPFRSTGLRDPDPTSLQGQTSQG